MTSTISIKNASMSQNTSEQTQAFIDCVLLYSKNLEADAVSSEL